MRDELVKKIRHCATDPMHCLSCGEDKDGRCFKRLMTQAADAIEKLSKLVDESIPKSDAEIIIEELSKPRWIPVSERLPEEKGFYLVYVKASKFAWGNDIEFPESNWTQITRFYDGKFLLKSGVENATVTHWQPLPEPPKEE